MFQWISSHFIPSEENQFQPKFLRLRVALLIVLMIGLLEGTYLVTTLVLIPRSDSFAAIFAAVLVDQTNRERSTESLGTLRTNTVLELAAKMKAEDMATKGYFSHNSPDGKTPWYWFEKAGYDYAAAGENLAVNFTDSKDVTEAWMRSPSHRANIMSGNYTEIGIATAQGTYKGRDAIFVVQEFGRPSLVARQIEEASSTAKALTNLITSATNPLAATVVTSNEPSTTVKQGDTAKKTAPLAQKQTTAPTSTTLVKNEPKSAVPTTTTVAGAGTEKLEVPPETFTTTSKETEMKPATKVEKLIASPRQITTAIYLVLAAILALALGLAIFIKIRIQHPHIIANGVLLLAIISSIIILNAALGFTQGVI